MVIEAMRAALRQHNLPAATLGLFYPLFLLQKATPGQKATDKQRVEAVAWQRRLEAFARAWSEERW